MMRRLLILGLLAWAAGGWEDGEWGLVYKRCGANGGVEEGVVEESVMKSIDIVSNGFYRGNSQSVEMMGQCDAHLDACECLQCFTHALRRCPASLSAQIRLSTCFLAYSYHPNSFPPGLNNNSSSSSSSITRIAAIVVGAVVALLLALLFFCFLTSRYSKRHYYYY